MGNDDAIEALRRPSSKPQAHIVGLQCEIKKMLMLEAEPKNESKNYGEEWAKCYTYFMIQVQVQKEEDWAHMDFLSTLFKDQLPVVLNKYLSTESAARDALELVMANALSKAGSTRFCVQAVCLAVSGVNHPTDVERIMNWLRDIFPSHVHFFVQNDAVAALASGTMGKLHGCVLIAGTGTIAYGFTEDGRDARAAGAGPVLGDWGSGYGIAAQALTAAIRAYDGRGPYTALTSSILRKLDLSSPDELIGAYSNGSLGVTGKVSAMCLGGHGFKPWKQPLREMQDPSWARIAALVPVVVTCAEGGDEVANKILRDAVEELASSVKAVVRRLQLCGEDGNDPFPLVMVGAVLEAKKKWDIGREVINCICKDFPGVHPICPKVEPAIGAALLAWNLLARYNRQGNLRSETNSP
ncbi:Actin-like ATPase superfamily protein isoform 2 [Capsicum annuum]|nr:Actin-like ATPase superfamily protein isoform 2 [Capsicum annuum]